jgi:P-type E1-E2 ATPase
MVIDAEGHAAPRALVTIEPGSRVWVEQGNQIPLDGTMIRGEATLDESALTGESVWVRRTQGEPVYAGTMNRGPGFEICTSAAADDTP